MPVASANFFYNNPNKTAMTKTDTKTLETQTTEILKAAGLWESMDDLVVQEVEGNEVIIFTLSGGKEEIKELLYFWATSDLIENDYSELEITIEDKLTDLPLIYITQSL
jgi:hypothetical protein